MNRVPNGSSGASREHIDNTDHREDGDPDSGSARHGAPEAPEAAVSLSKKPNQGGDDASDHNVSGASASSHRARDLVLDPRTTPTGASRGDVQVDEPLLPARVHRPADLLRFFSGLAGLALAFFLASFAKATAQGLENDVLNGLNNASHPLQVVIGFVASVAILAIPVGFAVERLLKRDGLRVADGVLAAVLAHGASLAVDLWIRQGAPDSVTIALSNHGSSGALTDPVHGYLAPVIAYMTAVGMVRRPRWRTALYTALLLEAAAVLLNRETTLLAIVVTVLIGWTVACGMLYAIGAPNVRPTGTTLLAAMRRLGFQPAAAYRAADTEDTRRYLMSCTDGQNLDITVLDREQQASNFFYRLWRRAQLRVLTPRRNLLSLRQALEHEALLAYAAASVGARVPRLIATTELGPDAVMLIYEHMEGRPLASVPDEELTDETLARIWQQIAPLLRRRIAHRNLMQESILLDASGAVILTNLHNGEIAASDLVLRMDIAELLCTLAVRVGSERSVAAATSVLGRDAVASSVPVLQPIGLSRETRARLKKYNKRLTAERVQRAEDAARAVRDAKERGETPPTETQDAAHQASEETTDLLSHIRHQVVTRQPEAPVEPVRLQRIKPRTLISAIAAAIAAYLLLPTLIRIDLATVFKQADWRWGLIAAVGAFLSYVGATMNLLGFVPEKVSKLRALMAQIAGSFVKVVVPAAVGGVALNTRFLQRSGIRPGLAVASVGASQLVGMGLHLAMLMVLSFLTGTGNAELPSGRTALLVLLGAAVSVLVVAAIPPLRRLALRRLRPLFYGVLPRMLDVLQRPQKVLTGVGGTLVLTAAFMFCLYTSVRAFGAVPDMITVAVVFLAGNAVGSAIPTPGGIGAVEAALTTGLVAFAGVPKDVATPAVLLFRLLTFWLPILPGWLCFTVLQRKEAL